jgi:hypothetical protein
MSNGVIQQAKPSQEGKIICFFQQINQPLVTRRKTRSNTNEVAEVADSINFPCVDHDGAPVEARISGSDFPDLFRLGLSR